VKKEEGAMSTIQGRLAPYSLRSLGAYLLLLAVGVGTFFLVGFLGQTLQASVPIEPRGSAEATGPKVDVFHILLALAVVVAVGQALGRLFRFIGQPPVIGEVVGGILLGPTLLGRLSPDAYHYVLPGTVAPYLEAIAQIGVILYMFLVGLELNGSLLRKHAGSTVAISHASIVCPFVLGCVLALLLYPRLSSSDVPFTSFALFMGVAMSITAFPVLARILSDRGLTRTPMGIVALTCAATDDLTAWCLLALLSAVVQEQWSGLGWVLLGAVTYVGAMLLAVRPLVTWLTTRYDRGALSTAMAAVVFVGLLLSSLATEAIGIHAIFGAFLFGAMIPHDSTVAREFSRRMGDVVTILLLPAFFALTGMRTRIDFGVSDWMLCGAIILAATVGKFGGTFGAARLQGLGWRDTASLGLLMNTRGLMELIVLQIGLKLQVIGPTVFSMMVLMSLVTTMCTSPLLKLLNAGRESRPGWSESV
jgi:Kef-type K+ transport system membrane component KefB